MTSKPTSWRDVLPIHPAAELFPRMSPDELKALAADIKKNGLKQPIVLWSPGYAGDGMKEQPRYVLDGINRLDACELAGISVVTDPHPDGPFAGKPGPYNANGASFTTLYENRQVTSFSLGRGGRTGTRVELYTDPYAYVVSANIHRRHLTSEQKRELIAKLIKAKPESSNNAIAKQVKADDKTVAKVRRGMEARSEIPNVATRTDTKGRKQPAKKSSTRAPQPPRNEPRAPVRETIPGSQAAASCCRQKRRW